MAGVLSSEQTAVAAAQHAGHGEIPPRAVIRLLVGLKWTLWKRSYQGNVGKIIGTAFGSLYALGAVIGRSLRYWRRDTRYLAAISIYPVMFVFFGAMGLVLPESRSFMMIMVVAMGGLTGIAISNEIGFDGPAGWVNITAGAPARANLLGRIIAASWPSCSAWPRTCP